MTDKELHRLRRSELLEIMLEQSKRIKELEEKNRILEQELSRRYLIMEKAGTLARASIHLNKMFETTQETADMYLRSVEALCRRKAKEAGAEAEWEQTRAKIDQKMKAQLKESRASAESEVGRNGDSQ